jgi:VanZ family protein
MSGKSRFSGVTLLCAAYVVGLSLLLVSRSPLGWLPEAIKWSRTARALEPVFHVVVFVPLGLVAFSPRLPVRGWLGVGFLIALAVGTELWQGRMPGRSASLWDAALGCAGIAVGALLYWAVRCQKCRRARAST